MAEDGSLLEATLWNILQNDHADEETGELSDKESLRVRRLIQEYLQITDSPGSRHARELADFIYWNCSSLSRDAAERWLNSLRDDEREQLMLGDVLGALNGLGK